MVHDMGIRDDADTEKDGDVQYGVDRYDQNMTGIFQ